MANCATLQSVAPTAPHPLVSAEEMLTAEEWVRQNVGPHHRPVYYERGHSGVWACGSTNAFYTNAVIQIAGDVWQGGTACGPLYQMINVGTCTNATMITAATNYVLPMIQMATDCTGGTMIPMMNIAFTGVSAGNTFVINSNGPAVFTEAEILEIYGSQLRGDDRARFEAAATDRRAEAALREERRREARARLEQENRAARVQEMVRSYRARDMRMGSANQKAVPLLFDHLTKSQRRSLRKHGFFDVTGADGHTRRLWYALHGNYQVLDSAGKPLRSYCGHYGENLPIADTLLCQLLVVKTDPERYEKRGANIMPIYDTARCRAQWFYKKEINTALRRDQAQKRRRTQERRLSLAA
jgi:hypothetical protein